MRAHGGHWIVRIEDVDAPRTVPGAADEILATLAHFGMHSDEPPVWQSARGDTYRRAFDRLIADGLVLFIRAAARGAKWRIRYFMRMRGMRCSRIPAPAARARRQARARCRTATRRVCRSWIAGKARRARIWPLKSAISR